MDADSRAGEPGRRREPRGMTLADLAAIVAGVALVMALPSRGTGWPPFLPPPPFWFLALIAGFQLAVRSGPVLALVVLVRRGRYGGPVRPAEGLALALAAVGLVDAVPNLDEAVNASGAHAAIGFGAARWLLSAPAALGAGLVAIGLAWLRRRARDASRPGAALSAVGVVAGLFLWFWGPCEVARLELPWALVPGPPGDPSSWGWRGPLVDALRGMVADAPTSLPWALLAAAAVRSWRADRRAQTRPRVWTEPAAVAASAVAALLLLAFLAAGEPVPFAARLAWWAAVGLASWRVTGRLGAGRGPARPADG